MHTTDIPSKKGLNNKNLDGRGKHFCIVASKYNAEIVDALVASATETLERHHAETIDIVQVPGAFEIPLMVQRFANKTSYDAIITLGCVIRGQTDHYDLIVRTCSHSIAQIMLEYDVPITLGILAVDDIAHAKIRSQPGSDMNRGRENALVALEMAQREFSRHVLGHHKDSPGLRTRIRELYYAVDKS